MNRYQRFVWQAKRKLKRIPDPIVGRLAVWLLQTARRTDRIRLAGSAARLMRRLGPWLPEHRIGRRNLVAAFPEKSNKEIEEILRGVWDNLGRVVGEFAHLDQMRVRPNDPETIGSYNEETLRRIEDLRKAEKPTAFFAAHLANWELAAVAAKQFDIDYSVLFRAPNVRPVADAVLQMRGDCMGTLVPSGFGAPLKLARALESGSNVGMLVDQHDSHGVDVIFFGRSCKANPLLAQLARHTGCFIRGIRVVRLAGGNRFWGEITEPLELPRDAEGGVDVQGTMQAITGVVEDWVREHPEQWLWLHRRWR
jgi:KDO2-lipid IV(A) lauroyltransferase